MIMPRNLNKENILKKKSPKKSKQFMHTSYEAPNPKNTQLIQFIQFITGMIQRL